MLHLGNSRINQLLGCHTATASDQLYETFPSELLFLGIESLCQSVGIKGEHHTWSNGGFLRFVDEIIEQANGHKAQTIVPSQDRQIYDSFQSPPRNLIIFAPSSCDNRRIPRQSRRHTSGSVATTQKSKSFIVKDQFGEGF